jgi:membrane protease YdiL (CAAX protease family)
LTSPDPPPPEPTDEVRVWTPFLVLAIVYLVVNVFGAAALGIAASVNSSIDISDPPDWVAIPLTILLDGLLVLGAWITLRLVRGHASPADLGLRRVANIPRAILLAAGAWALFWFAGYVLYLIFGNPPDQELVTELKHEDSWLVLGGFALLTCVLAPMAEELFFRGFMFAAFARRIGPVWGALAGGAVFGLVHAPNPAVALVALGVLGVGLCVLYWRTQSIIPCMALHALNNSVTYGITKSLHPAAFVGLVVISVSVVVGAATALASRPAVAA